MGVTHVAQVLHICDRLPKRPFHTHNGGSTYEVLKNSSKHCFFLSYLIFQILLLPTTNDNSNNEYLNCGTAGKHVLQI